MISWLAHAEVPFSWALSKNRTSRRRAQGGYFMPEEARELMTGLALSLRAKLNRVESAQRGTSAKKGPGVVSGYRSGPRKASSKGQKVAKVWLDIMLHLPDRRGDPLNLLDALADSVAEALNCDDRSFAVWKLDWKLAPENPRIAVRVGVE